MFIAKEFYRVSFYIVLTIRAKSLFLSSAQVEADVPLSEAWALWSNQENVVNWMPWIASVKVLLTFGPTVEPP